MSSTKSNKRWMSGQSHPKIVTIGDPRLRQKTKAVANTTEVKTACDGMVSLLRELKGAGLAAPQVGNQNRIMVVEVRKTDLFPDRPETPLYVFINPHIVEASNETEEDWEGCFSIPGLMGRVSRHMKIALRYTTQDGVEQTSSFEGYVARVIQHELDHLDGIVFVDRMSSMSSLTTVENYVNYHHGNQETRDA